MRRRRFFTWLKDWLARLSHPQPLALDWFSEPDGVEGAGSFGQAQSGSPRPASGLPPARMVSQRILTQPRAEAHLKSAVKAGAARDWLRRSPMDRGRRTPPAASLREMVSQSETAAALTHAQSLPGVAASPRTFSRLRRQAKPKHLVPPRPAVRWRRQTEIPSRQRPAMGFLLEVVESAAHQPLPPDLTRQQEWRGAPSEARTPPRRRSPAWLHLGPRLAADLPHFDS